MSPQAKKDPKFSASLNKVRPAVFQYWGEITVIVFCLIISCWLWWAAQHNTSGFGSGLGAISRNIHTTNDEIEGAANTELTRNKNMDGELEFYERFKNEDSFMPPDLENAKPEKPDPNTQYFVQAASSKTFEYAQNLRSKLAVKGFKSIVQTRQTTNYGLVYRIRLGPYANRRQAQAIKNKLQKLRLKPFIYSTKK